MELFDQTPLTLFNFLRYVPGLLDLQKRMNLPE